VVEPIRSTPLAKVWSTPVASDLWSGVLIEPELIPVCDDFPCVITSRVAAFS